MKAKEELLGLAREVVARGNQVRALAENEKWKWQGAALRTVSQLKEWLELAEKVIRQTEAVGMRPDAHAVGLLIAFDPVKSWRKMKVKLR